MAASVQSAAPGALIELFKIDLTPINSTAPVLYFFPGSNELSTADFSALDFSSVDFATTKELVNNFGAVVWLGNTYVPLPISFEGADVTGKGAVPRPTLTVANNAFTISGLINLYGTIRGSIITRWQTFSQYLDLGSHPDPLAMLPIDQWRVDRIIKMNKIEAQLECRSFFDFQGKLLPSRQVMRDYCWQHYRVWDAATNTFNYTNVTCPYTGSTYFDPTNAHTSNPAQDQCSKNLAACKLRFSTAPPVGAGVPGTKLPFMGFPGAGQFPTS